MRRWREPADNLPPSENCIGLYRLPPLQRQLKQAQLSKAAGRTSAHISSSFGKPVPGALYKVVYGDTLRELALHLYGHATLQMQF